ncbi:MAG: hypothetical protein RLZZ127_249 [Planctomycetota bacterium]|jgi:prepilin-type N-terminal cleavage/methylation domain-containing protein
MSRNQGFTLIEILVVVSVIAVLAALLFPALGLLRRSSHAVATQHVMDNLATAINSYLSEDALLGDTDAGFAADPWAYLHRRWVAAGKPAPMESLALRHLGDAQGLPVSDISAGRTILDGFGRVMVFSATSAVGLGSRRYTTGVMIRSSGSDEADPSDDITMQLDAGSGNWRR